MNGLPRFPTPCLVGFALLTLFAGLMPLARAARAEMLSTPAGGLYYEVRGEGCPLVLVGGGSAMDSRQWDAARHLLAERFQVVSVDPRGIGRSENPTAAYSDADDLITLLDHLEIPAALFAGGSWGGAKVLEVALAHPDRVIGVVSVAPFLAGFEPSPEMTERIERFNQAAQKGPDAFLETARDDPHFLPAPIRPEAREIAWQLIRGTLARPEAADPSLARRPDPPIHERLGEFVSPILLVSGAQDHRDVSRRLSMFEKGIPGVQRTTIPDAGHTAAMENPQAFVQKVLPFLHGLGCHVWPTAKVRARAELLQLHRDVLRFHRGGEVEGWLEREAPVQILSSRGEVSFPTAGQRRTQREGYLGRTELTVYRDRRPPVVRVSDDLSQGWLLAEVEVEGKRKSDQGETPFRWEWAWVELFERDKDGAWRWVGNVSNTPPPDCPPSDGPPAEDPGEAPGTVARGKTPLPCAPSCRTPNNNILVIGNRGFATKAACQEDRDKVYSALADLQLNDCTSSFTCLRSNCPNLRLGEPDVDTLCACTQDPKAPDPQLPWRYFCTLTGQFQCCCTLEI